MTIDAAILDRIDVRYAVHARFDVGPSGDPRIVEARLSITCGLYDGVPDRRTLAGLVSARGVHVEDLDAVTPGVDLVAAAAAIGISGVRADDVVSAGIEEVLVDDAVAAEDIADGRGDEWDDAGPFLHRSLPEETLDDFFLEEPRSMTITRDMGRWWIGEPGASGQTPCDTVTQAKREADNDIAARQRALPGRLLSEAGLDASAWRVELGDGIEFQELDGDRAIVGDVGDRMNARQRWDAYEGDRVVREGCRSVAEALAAFSARTAASS